MAEPSETWSQRFEREVEATIALLRRRPIVAAVFLLAILFFGWHTFFKDGFKPSNYYAGAGSLVASAPASTTAISTPVVKPLVSCKEYKARQSNAWMVACNDNTADGYYWDVDQWYRPYGFFGLMPIQGQPPCKSKDDIGTHGLTASWREVSAKDGFWDVSREWCNRFNPKERKDCTQYNEGPTYGDPNKEEAAHTGIYHVICRRIPD